MKQILLAPIGNVDGGALRAIETSLRRTFGRLAECVEPLPDLLLPSSPPRLLATPVLCELAHRCPAGETKLLGVTEQDLFIPMLTFLYGQAQLGGRAAIVSLARLRQEFYGLATDDPLLRLRASKEALHEVGHTFGLVHCRDERCVMAASTGIERVDSKRGEFCRPCAILLGRSGW